ncbi:FusB/FusC family EF-G-binding protein [Bacillus sp. FJAT-49732]|uniref:FusB/FusC family EF-G-binding protein n=1 Tax=Lederbergia citrisecunda TaxID=2833583 RepID=A0A942YN51_9BACI|nr:FusB/FusC family EF-G-binding protein [Lederbergia citrisecunda]MBS4202367.1 FusB/FusC family EF-G-binding protein [Lederbergia citrisecunda]
MNTKPFIRCDQYNFIKFQVKHLVQSYSTIKDQDVLRAISYSSLDKVINLFPEYELYREIFEKIPEIKSDIQATHFLDELRPYVIPFRTVSEKTIEKLFPKAKKLKLPPMELDLKEISYLGWYDIRSERKYLVFDYDGKLVGINGTFRNVTKGICSVCNGHEEVGLFMANVKSGKETFTNRGNYICNDSQRCNQNIKTLDKLYNFIELVKKLS